METKTIDLQNKVLSEKTIYEGTTKKIEVKKYWDSHGKEVDWGRDTETFDHEVEVKITSKQVQYYSDFFPNAPIFEVWDIFVDGKKYNKEFELTGYRALKTKLVLDGCVGAG